MWLEHPELDTKIKADNERQAAVFMKEGWRETDAPEDGAKKAAVKVDPADYVPKTRPAAQTESTPYVPKKVAAAVTEPAPYVPKPGPAERQGMLALAKRQAIEAALEAEKKAAGTAKRKAAQAKKKKAAVKSS
jgi:hypothetical protein